ncbi:MAG: Hint domain-containing protein [Pseudomonadota bacterium]
MPQIAFWEFGDPLGSDTAVDSIDEGSGFQDGTFNNGAGTDGSGSATFDGENDFVEVPHDPEFDLPEGSIVITFTQTAPSGGVNPFGRNPAMTLFSRDSSGFDNGGHLTIFIQSDGNVGVRHQSESSSFNFEGGDVQLNQPTTVIYTWGPDGSQLIVDGTVVDSGTDALTMEGDPQPITIGASQAQSGNGTANNLTGFFEGSIDGVAIFDEPVPPDTVACFAAGTLIDTAMGPRPVEDLIRGMMIRTLDNGYQPLRWIGEARVPAVCQMAPIRFAPGSIGNERPLLLSRQHRVLLRDWRADLLFGESEVLVKAAHLVNDHSIRPIESAGEVRYFHLGFDNHEVVFAEGVPAESFSPGPEGLATLDREAREEFLTLFPQWESVTEGFIAPRQCLSARDTHVWRQLTGV